MHSIETKSALAPTYQQPGPALVRGEGVWLWDESGRRYLDLLSGIAVNALGHGHPAILGAMQSAMTAPIHLSNLYSIPSAEQLAARLCALSFATAVFFCNSGTEAIEGALKFARRRRPHGGIVACEGSFHGRTMGALSTTWNARYRTPFEPLLPGVTWLRLNEVDTIEAAITGDTTAVLMEPIQGEGGVMPATTEFLVALRQRCDATGAVLIFDEVQCGLGRTGQLWAYEHAGVEPDIMTLAKPLGGGLPIGAILMRESIANSLQPGDHGSTFGGGPFVTTVANAVLATIADPVFLQHVQDIAAMFHAGLLALQRKLPTRVLAVRGRGLMWGVQLAEDVPVAGIVAAGQRAGVLLGQSAGNTLRLLPPLILEATHTEQAMALLEEVLSP